MGIPVMTVVRLADDWAALYVDGVNVYEHHEVRVEEIITASKGQPFTLVQYGWDDGIIAWFEDAHQTAEYYTGDLQTVIAHATTPPYTGVES